MKPIVLVTIAVLALFGCSREQAGGAVEQIRAQTVKICSFVPTVTSVTAILAAADASGAVAGVSAIANAICNAVTGGGDSGEPLGGSQSLMDKGKECPKVNGVCVEGEFVDKDGKGKDNGSGSDQPKQ